MGCHGLPHGLPWAATWHPTWHLIAAHVAFDVAANGSSRGIPWQPTWEPMFNCTAAPVGSHGTLGGRPRNPACSVMDAHGRPRGMPWAPTGDRVGCRESPWASMGSAMGSHRNVKLCKPLRTWELIISRFRLFYFFIQEFAVKHYLCSARKAILNSIY